jgi:hypothetical protein
VEAWQAICLMSSQESSVKRRKEHFGVIRSSLMGIVPRAQMGFPSLPAAQMLKIL